ncbi:MAG: serine/threonine-protein kinase, partial [Planctomycetota bacterium]
MGHDKLENSEFAGFSVDSKVGEYASGILYEARGDGVSLHLKALPPGLTSSDHPSATRFMEALETAAGLRRENVLGVMIVDEADGIGYVALERVDGPTLSEILEKRGALPLHEGAAIVRQLLSGLEACHSAGLIHGELEPAKVVQAPDGTWKITGVGFPERYLLDADVGIPGQWPDVAHYAAPESAGVLEMDPRSDLYSLGAIAFEIFAGAPPFSAESDDELRESHQTAEPEYPGDSNPSLSPTVCEYVLRLLAKDPEDRFPDASTAKRALEAALAGVALGEEEGTSSVEPTEVEARDTVAEAPLTETDGTEEDGGGGLLAAAWASETDGGSGEDPSSEDTGGGPSLTDKDIETLKQAKGPTQVIEGVFASLGGSSTIRKKPGLEGEDEPPEKEDESPVTGLIKKEDSELPWDLGGDDSEHESRETFDISGSPGAVDGWERGGAETEEGFEEEPSAPLEGFVDAPPAAQSGTDVEPGPEGAEDPDGESEVDPEEEAAAVEMEKGRAVTTAKDHFGSEAAEEEEKDWVDLGPWKKGPEGDEKEASFDEFHEMRMGVASEVESKVSESGRTVASLQTGQNSPDGEGREPFDARAGPGKGRINPVVLIAVPVVLLIAVGILVVLLIQASGKKPALVPPEPKGTPGTAPPETKGPRPEHPPRKKGGETKVEKPAVDEKEMEARLASAVELKREGDWKGAVKALRPLLEVDFLSERVRTELDAIEAKRVE